MKEMKEKKLEKGESVMGEKSNKKDVEKDGKRKKGKRVEERREGLRESEKKSV